MEAGGRRHNGGKLLPTVWMAVFLQIPAEFSEMQNHGQIETIAMESPGLGLA